MTDQQPAEAPAAEPVPNWQEPSLRGLVALEFEAMPGFEVLFIDELAGYLMGAGALEPPYTVEHASRVVSMLLGSVVNSARFLPERAPELTEPIVEARAAFVQGAHDFAAKGGQGLAQLLNRLIPAVLGELEIHKDAPEEQTSSLFYYSMLAVASGPLNVLDQDAAAGVTELFRAWDEVFGSGYIPPWRQPIAQRPIAR
ncbi:MAG: hypothetical protein ABI418_17675 [Jatrophihabitantaceae bacterium]